MAPATLPYDNAVITNCFENDIFIPIYANLCDLLSCIGNVVERILSKDAKYGLGKFQNSGCGLWVQYQNSIKCIFW